MNRTDNTANMEIDISFSNKTEWDTWCAANKRVFDVSLIESALHSCRDAGLHSTFLGFCTPDTVSLNRDNYRESLSARGFNARQRAVLDIVNDEFPADKHRGARIHLHEGITPFARAVQSRYSYVLASEYLPDDHSRSRSFPIPHIDVCDSGLPDNCFDLIVSQEVLEHVPYPEAAFKDMARILKPGGKLIATVPFLQNRDSSLRKAMILDGGEILHLLPPEYHGNPIDPSGGSLVFEIPGWDILDRLKQAGFQFSVMRLVGSSRRGILSNGIAGLFLLIGQK
jgi:SAM-dependent methyltransferase